MKLSQLNEARYAARQELETAYVLYDQNVKTYIEFNHTAASGMSRRSDVQRATWWRGRDDAEDMLNSKKDSLIHDLESGKYQEGKIYYISGRYPGHMTARQAAAKNNSIRKQLKVYEAIRVVEIKVYM